tara:strand:- start:12 stop:428 length:417 start_codon:yes stop_codon:yes gene_type:complete
MNEKEFYKKMQNIYSKNKRISIKKLKEIVDFIEPNNPLKLKKNINTNFMINLYYNNVRLLRNAAEFYVNPNNFPTTEIQKRQKAQFFRNAVNGEIEKQYVNFKPTTTAHSRISNTKKPKINKPAPATPQSKRRKKSNK